MSFWELVAPVTADMQNECPNPSFESGTTGWAPQGTNTLAQSSTRAFRGVYSALFTYGNNSTNFFQDTVALTTSTTYGLIGRVWVPSDWDGGNVYFNAGSMTSAVVTTVKQFEGGVSTAGTWIKLYSTLVVAADGAGTISVRTDSAPTVGRTLYFDAFSYVDIASEPTYFDGDSPGCYWDANRHLSTATFDFRSRSAGIVKDLDDYSFYVEDVGGIGNPPQINVRQEFPLQPGSQHQRTNTLERLVTMNGYFEGSSRYNLHSIRKDLYDVLKDTATTSSGPMRLRYKGAHADNQAEIGVRFDGGMEFSAPRGFIENAQLRLLAEDPYFYARDDGSFEETTPTASLSNANGILHRGVDGTWDNMDEGVTLVAGASTVFTILVASDNTVYVGGDFNRAGSAPLTVANIARWDPVAGTWDNVAAGANDTVNDILEGPDGLIYVMGQFTSAGGDTNCNGVGVYDPVGDSWSDLDTGVDDEAYAGVFDNFGNLWIGGDFLAAGSGATSVNHIAYWDGAAWNAIGSGPGFTGGSVWTLAKKDNVILAGGSFTAANSVDTRRVAFYDLSPRTGSGEWVEMGQGINDNTVLHLEATRSGAVYVSGNFNAFVGGTEANYVGYIPNWASPKWLPLADGVTNIGSVWHFALMGSGWYWASGVITEVNNELNVDGTALWSGTDWVAATLGLPGGGVGRYYTEGPLGTYVGFDGEGTATVPTVQTVTNSGTAPSYPIIEIVPPTSGTAQLNQISNLSNGKHIYFTSDLTLVSGDRYILDLRRGQKTFHSVHGETVYYPNVGGGSYSIGISVFSFGEDLSGKILPGSNLADFRLEPGENLLFIYTDGSTVDYTMNWRNAHETADGVAA